MTPRQTEILRILQTCTAVSRDYIASRVGMSKREVQTEIAAIESEGYPIINAGGYKLAITPEDLDAYEHATLTLYAHAESERESADRKWALLQRKRAENNRESRAELQHTIKFETNGQGAFV